jgi:MFS family permease
MNNQKKGVLNPAIVAILAEGFFSRFSFGLISFALPLYALDLGLSLTQIGLLISFHLGISMLLKPSMGGLADRFGLKRSLTAGIVLRSVVTFLLTFTGLPWQLFAIESVHGAARALRTPSADALLAEHGGKKAVASAFAWYFTAKNVAGSLGKGLAGILLTLTGSNFQLVFFLAFLFSMLPLFVVARYVRPQATTEEQEPAADIQPDTLETQSPAKGSNLKLALLPFIGLVFLVAGTAQMLKGLFPILATEYAGLSEAQAGLILTASTVMILIAGPLFGWLSDNVSRDLVLTFRSVANTISSLIYIVAPNFAGVTVGKLVDEAGKAAFRPAWGALMAHVSSFDKRRRAQTMGILSLGEDAGTMAGPILAGFLWSTWGLTVLFGVRVLLAIIAEVYAVYLNRSMEARVTARGVGESWANQARRLLRDLIYTNRAVRQLVDAFKRPVHIPRGLLIVNAVLLPAQLCILFVFGLFAWSVMGIQLTPNTSSSIASLQPEEQALPAYSEANELQQLQSDIYSQFHLGDTLILSNHERAPTRQAPVRPSQAGLESPLLPTPTPIVVVEPATPVHTARATPSPTPTPPILPTPTLPPASAFKPTRLVYVQSSGQGHALGLVTAGGDLLNGNLHPYAAAPTWSPDGATLAFFGEPGINQLGGLFQHGSGVWLIDAGGGNPRLLVAQDHLKNIAWSPDGSKLAFEIGPPDAAHEIMIVDARDGRSISRFFGEQPAWAFDSQKLAIKACLPGCGLWQVNVAGGEGRQLTFHSNDSFPAWSPTGQYLAFTSDQGGGNWEIYRLRLADGNLQP